MSWTMYKPEETNWLPGLEAIAAKYPALVGPVRGWGLLKGVTVMIKDCCWLRPGKMSCALFHPFDYYTRGTDRGVATF